MMHKSGLKLSFQDKIFVIADTLILTIVLVVIIYPLIIIVSSSFSSPQSVAAGKVWLFPVDFNINGYKAVFSNPRILTGYANTILYTSSGSSLGIFLTILAAYPLSRKDFYGKNILMGMITFTMLFSGGLIPSYLINRALGFVDNRLAMIIPGALGVYYIIITRTFLNINIPNELLDAAQIDGCDDFHFVSKIVFPLSKTIIAVLGLFYAVSYWNNFTQALIYIRTASKLPLQVILRNILILSQVDDMLDEVMLQSKFQGMKDLIKYALIIVSSAPMLILYPFLQKYFVKGVMIGSLKG